MRTLAAILVAFTLTLTVVAESRAASHVKAPRSANPPARPCTFQNRLDIEIVGGIWFECSCEALMVGTVCDWYEITEPAHDPHHAPTLKKHAKPKHRRVVIHAAIPAVVA